MEALRAASDDLPTALVTVLATEGSAPRGAGTRMAVTRDSSAGTIGGGALEFRAIEQARAILDHPPGSWRVQDYPLGPLLGQCCGGRVRLMIERVEPAPAWLDAAAAGHALGVELGEKSVRRCTVDDPADWPLPGGRQRPGVGTRFVEPADERRRRLLLFGAGHVGRAIARLLPGVPIDLAWFDSRAEARDTPGVARGTEDELVATAAQADAGSAVLILTHDHALDYRLTAAALRSQAAFIGLIGSATKRARFLSKLEADGLNADQRARLTCPIGVAGVGGKRPAVIAIAAAAQLLALDLPLSA